MKKLFLSLATTLFLSPVMAQVPETMHFQGFLTDPTSGAARDGNFDLVFSIHDDPVSGFQYWTEPHNGVSVSDGLFDVVLGSQGDPLSIAFDVPYWLEVSVDGETLSPRYELATTAYAFTAKTAETALEVVGVNNVFPSSGSVGIGTSSPQLQFQVLGSALITNGRLEIQETSSASEGGELLLAYADANPAIPTGFIIDAFNDGVNNQLRFFNPSITMMFLDENGDLDVTGSVRANSFIGDGSALTNLPATSAVWSGSPDISYSGGNVGIGNASPLFLLDMQGSELGLGVQTRIQNFDASGFAGYRLQNDNRTYSLSIGGSTSSIPNSFYIFDNTAVLSRFVLDENGNVGIGTNTPTANFEVQADNAIVTIDAPAGNPHLELLANAGAKSWDINYNDGDNALKFVEDGTDRLVIQNGGNVGIGIDPAHTFHVEKNISSDAVAGFYNLNTGPSGGIVIGLGPTPNPTSNHDFITFRDGSSTFLGAIEGDGLGSVAFPAISDRRLKKNIEELSEALETIGNMKPRTYEFHTAPGRKVNGFIAQELLSVYPQVVSGDPMGNVKTDPMAVDYAKLTPLLTKAIQEQQELIDSQEERIARLEELVEKLIKIEGASDTKTKTASKD